MIAKIIALLLPMLLFGFKYGLPWLAEEVYTKRKREKEQIKIELLHFPVDLLFVAISYTISKIIEVSSQLTLMESVTVESISEYKLLISYLVVYSTESLVILLLVPIFVFLTKLSENNYYKKKRKWIFQTLLYYLISIIIIAFSIFGL